MLKENLKNEKIQTNVAEESKSENLQKCSEQDSQEKLDVPAWRSRALKFLDAKIDKDNTILVSYQYSRLIENKWSPFVPYSSYIHLTAPRPDIKSIILGSLENLDVGTYLFKLIDLYVYRDCWWPSSFDSEIINPSNVLKLNVFEHDGVKGFEVIAFLHYFDLRKEFKN